MIKCSVKESGVFIMNKYFSILAALCVLPMSAFAATDLGGFDDRVPLSEKLLRQYKNEGPNVVFRDRNKDLRIGRWYASLNGNLSFLTWKNKYTGTDEYGTPISGSESFNFKSVMGADLAVGYRIDEKWRIEGELGYVGKYNETETEYYGSAEKTEFSLESYYVTANGYYDLIYGFYAGLGAGLAIVNISAYHSEVYDASTTKVSLMGAAMLGWSYMLDEKIDFDVRYRLSVFDGGDLNIGGATSDTGIILNNTFGLGIRYHF